jgi:hypothetical protein
MFNEGMATMHQNNGSGRARRERAIVATTMAALTTVWFGLTGAHSAHAQQTCTRRMTEQQQKDNAVAWWEQGARLYQQKRYRESIPPFQRAYDCATLLPASDRATKTAANFLFNIAQAHRQLGECRPAIQHYERYLGMTRRLTWDEQVRDVRVAVTETLDGLEKDCPAPGSVTEQQPAGTGQPDPTHDSDDDAPEDDGQGVGTAVREGHAGVTGTSRGDVANGAPDRFAMSIGMGPAFIGMGDIAVPTQLALAVRAGYPMRIGALDIEVGGAFTYTPISWRNLSENTSGTTFLWSILLDAGISSPIMDRLSIRGDIGLGALNFSGLEMSNPFTSRGAAPDGPLTMFNVRVELGVVYAITPSLMVNAAPLVFSYSPADKSLNDVISSLTRYELLIGAGYRM